MTYQRMASEETARNPSQESNAATSFGSRVRWEVDLPQESTSYNVEWSAKEIVIFRQACGNT